MKKVSKKNIIITGGTGLLGGHFYNKYKLRYNIIKYKGRIEESKNFERWIKNKKFDYFIHFAAITKSVTHSNKKKFNLINIVSTKKIILFLNKLKMNKFKYFLFISSSHVYGYSKIKIKETHTRNPHNAYGISKKKIEDFIYKNKNKYFFKFGIARIFNITGKKQSAGYFIPDMSKKIKLETKLDNINKYRDFIHLDDAVKALELLLIKQHEEPINISSGKKINLMTICKWLGKKKFVKKISFNKRRGGDIYGDNSNLRKLGIKKFKNIYQILKPFI
ncbi:SDR family oxidoreductase [Pelagibacteraceae bacterium]|nr:SDR family oxidoreductase [Pelagibacteraceae bacterium]